MRYLELTGSSTSIHLSVELSTNLPPIKFLVLPPDAFVPFQDESSSAFLQTSGFMFGVEDMVGEVERYAGVPTLLLPSLHIYTTMCPDPLPVHQLQWCNIAVNTKQREA